ncbi:formate dehydrogenase accessory sulfurtransferase FdhD [Pseudooceanicola sediminis]|uniref:Sulfur carrier protein FdhD n=1 Tax=Pseudooceanicola sediminis TaxID=2211117 RepID=A0A399J226_9RHOB|nr:formate dehydrogenase accessory sulfurtransferase FdhD [Pseudooceanicola sediminis]KAA2313869.1 formate dehydrogenase accessory sulfurtransferase FdhD [Puniceibacterium sp. HSS470]RII38687.1 formate dehydrogenase accessory sulfurtransferase FdhD [Pseudooceanicola sediminis]|tara:strand:- start:56619 stop:57437 length:819 start_codon:yes stop_codon:yes gene_type:complete
MPSPVISVEGRAIGADGGHGINRALPEEWPVALVYDGSTQAVMMCTPQDLSDFALGFSLTEGFVEGVGDIRDFELVEHETGSEARFWLAPERAEAVARRRRAMAGPVGCGLCGIDSLSEAVRALPHVAPGGPEFTRSQILDAVAALRDQQPLHDRTRAIHAAGFVQPGAGLVLVREDVGRHNALDKLIGALIVAEIDPASGAFVMTSRLSVELVQKAAMVGCPAIIAVSAPTAHAVRLAKGAGITLVAFARGQGFDLFSHPERILSGASDVA